MSPVTRARVAGATAVVLALGALAYVAFGRIGENLVYYWSPSELLAAGERAYGATVRLGGVVEPGSVAFEPATQRLQFRVTDGKATVTAGGRSAPPQMFREGIGVVVEGTYGREGTFEIRRLMVKHSNEYRAPRPGERPEDLYRTLLAEDGER